MIRRFLLALALLSLCLFATPRPVAAFNFFQGADCADHGNATVCQSEPKKDAHGHPIDPLTGPDGILAHITGIVAYIAGAGAVIVIIISAFRFITSGSNVSTGSRTDTDVEDARRALGNAVIGLVIIVLARTLIVYVLNRL